MANTIEVKVPDLGGSSEVPVIEVLVKVGDTIKKDQGLVTLERYELPGTLALVTYDTTTNKITRSITTAVLAEEDWCKWREIE